MSPSLWGLTESGLGVPFREVPRGHGVISDSGGGGRGSLSLVKPEARSSLAGFHLRKMSPAEAPLSFGDKTPWSFLSVPHHSETCQEPR